MSLKDLPTLACGLTDENKVFGGSIVSGICFISVIIYGPFLHCPSSTQLILPSQFYCTANFQQSASSKYNRYTVNIMSRWASHSTHVVRTRLVSSTQSAKKAVEEGHYPFILLSGVPLTLDRQGPL